MPEDADRDDESGGLPPHPLDRAWFHPSELRTYTAAPEPRRPDRDWTMLAIAGLGGAVLMLVVLTAAGALDGGSSKAVPRAAVAPTVVGFAESAEQIVELSTASVVGVRTTLPDFAQTVLRGSGVAVGRDEVLTAASLVDFSGKIEITTSGGRVLPGTIAGMDQATDLALVRVDSALPVAHLGKVDGLRVGQAVVALGRAGGNHNWTSYGVISGLDRLAGAPEGTLVGVLETDVDLSERAAGGALLDEHGEVIGIMSGAVPGSALPIDVAHDVADQIAATGFARHGWLGISASDADDHEGGGARIQMVIAGGPAEVAGLERGDVVTGVGTVQVTDMPDLMAALLRHKPGDPVTVVVWRGENKVRTQASLGERAAGPATMGIT